MLQRPLGSRAWSLAVMLGLAACGGGGGGSSESPPAPTPNRPPVFTSAGSASVPENAAGTIYTATATDADANAVTFSLAGTDAAAFRLSGTGELSFITPPDFEAPADADGNNVYLLQLTASDGMTTSQLALSVTVTNGGSDAFRVRRVTTGLSQPLFVAPVPDGSARIFVVERTGRIRIVSPASGTIAPEPFLDVATELSLDGERGLLGLATAPDFTNSGVFYVYLTNREGTNEVRRYRTLAANRDRADPTTADVILAVPHPGASNHNGGWIGFGPDGFLYVASGDGGGAGDPARNAQNNAVLLGKMLRLDVASDGFPGDPLRDYAIPTGNPFAASGGAPEIWALGLRNPFRNSFDSATGNLLIGDVGQNAVEEIDLMRPGDGGANFGWSQVEGTRPFNGQPNASFVPPVTEYEHGSGPLQGNSVTGGYVYRGPVEALRGQYIFADFVRPQIWSVAVSRLVLGQTLPSTQFTIRTTAFAPDAGTLTNISSFGVDQSGNLYIVDLDGELFVIEPSA